MDEPVEVAIIGGGAAGLGSAGALRRKGIESLVLEQAPDVGQSWRRRYEGLRLNTVRWMSGLPGMRIPRAAGPWPNRDDFVSYLESYKEHHQLEVRTGVRVERIDRDQWGFRLETSAGNLSARFVVVATGYDHSPLIPNWPGRERFAGELLHASSYRNAEPYRGRDLLVVGAGNTGSELAVGLLKGGARTVTVSMRTPPNFLRRDICGLPATPLAQLGEWLGDLGAGRVADYVGFRIQRRLHGELDSYG
ncbi:MAG TPA: NAD(P)/FAD-dependent oxidoreductase, partial [Gemmatimonadales bacterium]|nr:NAD(P)/FAD-dependent oxidoreductase [Gemmatimonadales bacterium]